MASPGNIKIVVEKAVHQALSDVAVEIWEQHGICIHNVNFSWRELSTMSERIMQLESVSAVTETYE